jgi:hypothetical protein
MSAWAPSTSLKYSAGITSFMRFCDSNDIPCQLRLPADKFTLCAYAASHLRWTAGSTACSNLSAVRAWHIANNVPYAGQNSLRLRYTLKGVENLCPLSSRKPVRPPVTRRLLEILQSALNPASPLDAAVLACATTAMWGQIRLGEILAPAQSHFTLGRIPCWSDLLPPVTSAGSRLLYLPWTKVTASWGAKVMLCRQHALCDPLAALQNHRRLNYTVSALPLFLYLAAEGSLCLTKKKFLGWCNEIWACHGLPTITGHSFRIGGTTELLVAGVPPDIVKVMGRWSSDAFLTYWRLLELIAPRYAELLPLPHHNSA